MKNLLFNVILLFTHGAIATEADDSLDLVIQGCLKSPNHDEICNAIVDLKNIGDDSIEAIKQYAKLTPRQYFALTVANALARQRLRIRTKSYFFENGNDTLDLRPDGFFLTFELKF
mgnify:CR=1 FL=1